MLNFEFYNPTRIIFGKDTIAQVNSLIPPSARVLILLGGSSARKNGTLDEVKAALGTRKVEEFSGIEANPTFETLLKAVDMIRREKIDFLLAVGGGSVIDGTKFVAAAVELDGDPWSILETRGAVITKAMPFASVLTLPATASEMNCTSVITRKETVAKLSFRSPHVFPQFSILDPTKTYTLPPRQVANGVVDAFIHVLEQYLTYPVNALIQDRFAEGILQTLIEIAPKVMEKPNDYESRANFVWAATMALNGLIGAGVPQDWATHRIGHEITARFDIDHARTLAIVLPSLLRECRADKHDKLLQYAERIWRITEGTENERIEKAIAATVKFFESLGIKTKFSDYGIKKDALDGLIEQLKEHDMTTLGEHAAITPEVSRRILEASL